MIEMTICVPNDLADRLQTTQAPLSDILEAGLQRHTQNNNSLYAMIINFLATGPTPEQITSFQLSAEWQQKISDLLQKNREGILSVTESLELDEYQHINHLMTRLKLQARQHLKA